MCGDDTATRNYARVALVRHHQRAQALLSQNRIVEISAVFGPWACLAVPGASLCLAVDAGPDRAGSSPGSPGLQSSARSAARALATSI